MPQWRHGRDDENLGAPLQAGQAFSPTEHAGGVRSQAFSEEVSCRLAAPGNDEKLGAPLQAGSSEHAGGVRSQAFSEENQHG